MLGEYDLVAAGRVLAPGRRLTSMMAPSIVARRDGAPRLVVGSAGSARLRGAIMQIVVNVVEHGLAVEEAIDRPRVHVDEPHVHCEGGTTRRSSTGLEAVGLRRRPLAAAEPLLRRRRRGRGARGRLASPPPAIRGAAARASSSEHERRCVVRAGRRPGDARRARRAAQRGRRRAGGLAARRRRAGASVARRAALHPGAPQRTRDAALFVAEARRRDRRPALGRARPAPGERARRRPRPDGRRRRTAAAGSARALLGGRRVGAAAGVASSSCTSSRTTSRDRALRELGYEREGYRRGHYRRGRPLRRRDPDGEVVCVDDVAADCGERLPVVAAEPSRRPPRSTASAASSAARRAARSAAEPCRGFRRELEQLLLRLGAEVDAGTISNDSEPERAVRRVDLGARGLGEPAEEREHALDVAPPAARRPRPSTGSTSAVRNVAALGQLAQRGTARALDDDVHPPVVEGAGATSTTAARVPTSRRPCSSSSRTPNSRAVGDALADQLLVARLEDVQRHALGRQQDEPQREQTDLRHAARTPVAGEPSRQR